MFQFHFVLDQPKELFDYITQAATVVTALAALMTVIVAREISRRQTKLQETLANRQFDLQRINWSNRIAS
jgi:hypothetical protein